MLASAVSRSPLFSGSPSAFDRPTGPRLQSASYSLSINAAGQGTALEVKVRQAHHGSRLRMSEHSQLGRVPAATGCDEANNALLARMLRCGTAELAAVSVVRCDRPLDRPACHCRREVPGWAVAVTRYVRRPFGRSAGRGRFQASPLL